MYIYACIHIYDYICIYTYTHLKNPQIIGNIETVPSTMRPYVWVCFQTHPYTVRISEVIHRLKDDLQMAFSTRLCEFTQVNMNPSYPYSNCRTMTTRPLWIDGHFPGRSWIVGSFTAAWPMGDNFMLVDSNGYGSIPINTIFRGMNIHLPAILMFIEIVSLTIKHGDFP